MRFYLIRRLLRSWKGELKNQISNPYKLLKTTSTMGRDFTEVFILVASEMIKKFPCIL
jgi:hypothetical protein